MAPPTQNIARTEGAANMLTNYADVFNNPEAAQSLGQYDPNSVDLNKAMDVINKNYVDYVTSPVTPALAGLASTQFNPQMAAYQNLGKEQGQGSLMSAIKGAAEGANQTLSGQNIGGSGPGGASAMNPIDVAKFNLEVEGKKKANTDLINKDSIFAPAIEKINTYKQFQNQWNDIQTSKGNYDAPQVKALMVSLMQMEKPNIRITDESGNIIPGADALAVGPLAPFAGILKKLSSGTELPSPEELNSAKKAATKIYESAKEIADKRIDQLSAQDTSTTTRANYKAFKNSYAIDDLDDIDTKEAKAAQQKNAVENATKNAITGTVESKRYPKAGTPSVDGMATADGKGGWIENNAAVKK